MKTMENVQGTSRTEPSLELFVLSSLASYILFRLPIPSSLLFLQWLPFLICAPCSRIVIVWKWLMSGINLRNFHHRTKQHKLNCSFLAKKAVAKMVWLLLWQSFFGTETVWNARSHAPPDSIMICWLLRVARCVGLCIEMPEILELRGFHGHAPVETFCRYDL